MDKILGPQARIALRYVIGYLAAQGVIPEALVVELGKVLGDTGASIVDFGILFASGIVVELIYRQAKKRGWSL